jgi:hypothetical protein
MQHHRNLEIPDALVEACDPQRIALLVYDMQVGVIDQLPDGPQVTERVARVLEAARGAGVRVFFTMHTTLPTALMGAFQLRTWMAWQRKDRVEDVVSPFCATPPGSSLCPSSPRSQRRPSSTSCRCPLRGHPARIRAPRRAGHCLCDRRRRDRGRARAHRPARRRPRPHPDRDQRRLRSRERRCRRALARRARLRGRRHPDRHLDIHRPTRPANDRRRRTTTRPEPPNMSAAIDILQPDSPKRIVIVASNPAVSEQTGWPIGFWWPSSRTLLGVHRAGLPGGCGKS